MKPKHAQTGFGLFDSARQVARRYQHALEVTENPPPFSATPEPFPLPELLQLAHTEKKPLAA